MDGSYGTQYVHPEPRIFEATATFDWDAPSVLYDSLQLECPSQTIRFSEDLTTGPGVSSRIETALFVDPICVRASDLGPLELISYTEKRYKSESYIYTGEGVTPFDNVIFAGSYEVVGPTESATGAFSIEIKPADVHLDYTIDTACYPSGVWLTREWGWGDVKYYVPDSDPSYVDSTIVDVVVDGAHVQIYMTKSGIQCALPYTIPEPVTLVLLGMGALMLRAGRRQRIYFWQ